MKKKLERILEAGHVAPTACNKQPQRIITVQNLENIQPTALLILGYPKNGFLDANRHLTERKPINETVMMEEYSEFNNSKNIT